MALPIDGLGCSTLCIFALRGSACVEKKETCHGHRAPQTLGKDTLHATMRFPTDMQVDADAEGKDRDTKVEGERGD